MQCPDEARVRHQLWPPAHDAAGRTPREVFAVLDMARSPQIRSSVLASAPHLVCLEPGRLSPEQQAAAPYAVRVQPSGPVIRQWLGDGWGDHWGIFAVPGERISLEAVRRHFHALLRVRMPEGDVAIFRFYDPRVFRVFLPTGSPAQLKEFFGPFDAFWVEDEDAAALLRFRLEGGRLERTRIALATPDRDEWPSELLPIPPDA